MKGGRAMLQWYETTGNNDNNEDDSDNEHPPKKEKEKMHTFVTQTTNSCCYNPSDGTGTFSDSTS